MQDQLESKLIDLYYSTLDGEWALIKFTPRQKKVIQDYVITKVDQTPEGKAKVYYKLSSPGKIVAEFVLKKYFRETAQSFGGLALEKRQWLIPKRHSLDPKDVIEAFEEIAQLGEIPVEIKKDWGRWRIVFWDLDRGLSRISYKIEWESNKHLGERYLATVANFSPTTVWLWMEVLDKHRKEIRGCHFQQEFVLWGS